MRAEIAQATKEAMKEKDTVALSTLRLISAAIKDKDIEARGNGNEDGIEDAEIIALLGKMLKQRQDSVTIYEEGGRIDLAERERAEMVIIQRFLPRQLSKEEVNAVVDEAIRETGAESVRDLGKVMAFVKERYAGQVDYGKLGGLVKDRLK